MTMFEYNKLILEKVSFEPRIFKKELRKAFRNSTRDEITKLKAWCRNKFSPSQDKLAF